MDVRTVLATKRDGRALSEEEIRFFLDGYVRGEIPDYQASALLMGGSALLGLTGSWVSVSRHLNAVNPG